MHRLLSLALGLVVTGCGWAPSSPTGAPTEAASQTSALPASSDAMASPSSVAEPDGAFIFVPAVIDCPGGCPTSTIAEALADPGDPGIPLLVEGAVLIDPEGTAWFCEGLTEDSPPMCSGAILSFDNATLYAPSLDANGLQELDGFQWLDDVTLPGEVTPAG